MRRVAEYIVGPMRNTGIVVAGTTGESPTLSTDEKLAVLETVLDAVGDRAAVVFGAGTYDTRESVHLTREGTRRGAHGIMLVNPYYSRPGQKGLIAHFRAVARETDLRSCSTTSSRAQRSIWRRRLCSSFRGQSDIGDDGMDAPACDWPVVAEASFDGDELVERLNPDSPAYFAAVASPDLQLAARPAE